MSDSKTVKITGDDKTAGLGHPRELVHGGLRITHPLQQVLMPDDVKSRVSKWQCANVALFELHVGQIFRCGLTASKIEIGFSEVNAHNGCVGLSFRDLAGHASRSTACVQNSCARLERQVFQMEGERYKLGLRLKALALGW